MIPVKEITDFERSILNLLNYEESVLQTAKKVLSQMGYKTLQTKEQAEDTKAGEGK